MAADAILDFQKFKILTVDPLQWANMHHHAKFHQNWSNGCRYGDLTVFFQDGGRPPSWICWAPIGTTHDDHLVVSIIVPNLVKIDAVVSITYQLSIFGPFGLKTPIHTPKLGFSGDSPQNGEQYQRNSQKAHPCVSLRSLSHQASSSVKIRRRVRPVGD